MLKLLDNIINVLYNIVERGVAIMAGYIKIPVEKFETKQINTQIDSEIFGEFQKKCKQNNIPMNVVIEAFARQYANERYSFDEESILKWKDKTGETSTLNTPINKVVYHRFKDKVKSNRYFVKHVLSAFIEDYGKNDLHLEYRRD